MRANYAALFVLLAVAGGLVFWLSLRPTEGEVAVNPRAAASLEQEGDETALAKPSGPGHPSEPESGEVAAGQVQARRVLGGPMESSASRVVFVRDRAGDPVQGAHVSWTPLDGDVLGAFQGEEASEKLWLWTERQARIEAATRLAITDQAGRAVLPVDIQGPESEVQGALWVSHFAFSADLALTDPVWADSLASELVHEFQLEPAAIATVRVLDGEGRAVEGASIEQLALLPAGIHPLGASNEVRARRALLRKGRTDADGVSELQAFPGRQLVIARAGEEVAQVRLFEPVGRVELRLTGSFTFSGRVHWEGPGEVGDWAFVSVHGLPPVGPIPLMGAAHVRPDGSFGPLRVPLAPGVPRYRFHFEHGALLPVYQVLPAPAPGEHVSVDLKTKAGSTLWVAALDYQTKEMLPDTRIEFFWREPEGSTSARTAAHGWAELTSVPIGPVHVRAQREGYAAVRFDSEVTEAMTSEGYLLGLEPAALLRGQVIGPDGPVDAFDVLLSGPGRSEVRGRWHFSDALDGRFEIADAPAGHHGVRALLATGGSAGPVEIRVESGESAEVVLEARPTEAVRGRFLDRRTLEPIEGVVAELFLAERSVLRLARTGLPTRSGADGRFALDGAVAGETFLTHTAPDGTIGHVPLTSAGPDGFELGDLLLDGRVGLLVELIGGMPDGPGPFQLHAGSAAQIVPFGADGRAFVEIAPKAQVALLQFPDDTFEERYLTSAEVLAGTLPWHVRPGRLLLELVGEEPPRTDPPGIVHVVYRDPQGKAVHRTAWMPGRQRELPGVPAARAQVLVQYRGHDLMARGEVELDASGGGELTLELAASGSLELRGPDGEPLAGSLVDLFARDSGGVSLVGRLTADERGRLALPTTPRGGTLLFAGRTQAGLEFGEYRLQVPAPGVVHTVQMELKGLVAVEVREMGRPVSGARIVLRAPESNMFFDEWVTDTAGRVTTSPMEIVQVAADLDDARFWPTRAVGGPSSATLTLEAYRKGTWDLTVYTAEGEPAAGAQVELQHEALDESVSTWLAAGRVQGHLVADSAGRVRLMGLPRGMYRLRAQGAHGSAELSLEFRAIGAQSDPVVLH